MSDQVNLKRLARELNLAVSTVSRALRDSYEISQETKDRVFSLARKLNYRPNPYASSLRLQKSGTIAVVVPEITNNFFSLVINGIEDVASEKGYHVLIYLTHESYSKELSSVLHLQSGRVDGVLMSFARETETFDHVQDTLKKEIPVVLFDRISDQIDVPKVTTDNYEGGFRATEHLIKNGCRRIAYLSSSPNLFTSRRRMQGYVDALHRYGIGYDPRLVIGPSGEQAESAESSELYRMLKGKKRPDGIFASVERLAILAYRYCADLKLEIPTQVKLVCFANLETAPLLAPPMTTVMQPAFEMGREAAGILFKLIEKKPVSRSEQRRVLHATLIERGSSRSL